MWNISHCSGNELALSPKVLFDNHDCLVPHMFEKIGGGDNLHFCNWFQSRLGMKNQASSTGKVFNMTIISALQRIWI